MIGTVTWFSAQKGYGFIKDDNSGQEVFCHFEDIAGKGYRELSEGEKVEFDIVPNPQKPGKMRASNVRRSLESAKRAVSSR